MNKYLFMGVFSLFMLSSCQSRHADNHHDGHNHATENHDHAAENHDFHNHDHNHDHGAETHEGSSDEIVLSQANASAAGVKVSAVKAGPFHEVIKTSGQIMAAQGDESVAVATVAGVVSFKGKVIEGMSVTQGTPLVMLSSNNMAEGDPVQKARIAFEIAQKEYNRKKALAESRIVSEKDFAQTKQAYENARISYEAVAKHHSNSGQAVVSPMTGYVKNLLVKEGDYVTVGQPLVSITQNRRLFLRADVSEKYYHSLNTIRSANFRTPYNNQIYSLDQLNGRLLSYGKTANSNSYYIPVTFEFDNRGEVIPGSFVEIYLLGSTKEQVIAIPYTSLTEEQGSFYVYLQLDESCYKKQLVSIGASNGKEVEIKSGLHEGQQVVTEGAYQVKLAGATHAIPAHSHEH